MFFLAMGLVTFPVHGAYQTQTIDIDNTAHDGFITEAGIQIDSHLAHILDPNMDIRAFLIFLDVEINAWDYLDNATLRLTSASTLPFDADSSVTVYGMAGYDLQKLSGLAIYSPGDLASFPLTSAHVNVNTSLFYGGAVLDIDVTNIVREIYDHPHWDGDGRASTNIGDAMGFIILGAEDEIRYFYDYLGDPARSAELTVRWGSTFIPQGGIIPPGATFINMTGGWQIWRDNPWLNFSTFTVYGADAGAHISGLNDTYFHVDQIRSQHRVYIQRNFTDDGTGIYGVKFGIEFLDLQAAAGGYDWYGLWGLSDTNASRIADWGEGYAFVGRTFDLADDAHRGTAWDVEAGAIGDSNNWFYSINHVDSNMPYTLWYDITLNMNGAYYNVSTYNDMEMTDLNGTINYAFTDLPPTYSPGAFPYETLVNSWDNLVSVHGYTGNYRSNFIDGAEWWVYDPVINKTLPVPDCDKDGDIDEDDAKCLVGDVDPHPEDPAPGSTWIDQTEGPFTRFRMRAYVFMAGFFCVWGPIWFFAWKRPSAYYLMVGALIIITGLGLMMGSATI